MSIPKDPQLSIWLQINYTGREILRGIEPLQNSQLSPVAIAFKENMEQVLKLSMLPETIYAAGKIIQMTETAAHIKVTGEPFPENFTKPIRADIVSLRDAMLGGSEPSPIPSRMIRPSDDEQIHAFSLGNIFPVIVDLLMPMQITTAWTVFETLFSDLWDASLIVKPSIRPLRKNGKIRKFTFSKVQGDNGANSAYTETFNDAGVTATMNDNSLGALCELRNLIVHQAGRCDKKYLSFVPKYLWLPIAAEGDKIKLNGQQIHNLLVGGLHMGVRIIKQVDDWLVNHP